MFDVAKARHIPVRRVFTLDKDHHWHLIMFSQSEKIITHSRSIPRFRRDPVFFCILMYNLLSSFKPGSCESCAGFPPKTETPDNVTTRAIIVIQCAYVAE